MLSSSMLLSGTDLVLQPDLGVQESLSDRLPDATGKGVYLRRHVVVTKQVTRIGRHFEEIA